MSYKNLTLFHIKLLAIVTMVIDHVGMIFFPGASILRIVGRLAFPLFAWGIANGYHHTSSPKKYLGRLSLLAIISQIPYGLIYGGIFHMPWRLNVFVTLALGLGMIMLLDRLKHDRVLTVCVWVVVCIIGAWVPIEYGLYGLVLIYIFHFTYAKHDALSIWGSVWMIVGVYFMRVLPEMIPVYFRPFLTIPSWTQAFALLAIPLISMYNGEKGYTKGSWWFYWFYPVHLLVLWGIYTYF